MHSVYTSTFNYMEYNILVIIHDEYSIALTEIFFIFFRNTAYIQQVGRAGRSGGQCAAVIFCNNSDLGRQGVTSSVKMTQYVGKLLLILILVLKVTLMT